VRAAPPDDPSWVSVVLASLEKSGWAPLLGGLGFLIARPFVRALFPPGYYFRFMDRVLRRSDDERHPEGEDL
jgi:hypothetical protein